MIFLKTKESRKEKVRYRVLLVNVRDESDVQSEEMLILLVY